MLAKQLLSVLLVVGLSCVSSAKQFHWKANGTGNWADPTRWEENDVPGVGDQVRIDHRVASAGDVDADILGKIGELVLPGETAVFNLTNNVDMTLKFKFYGEGLTVKYGTGRLTLDADANEGKVATGLGIEVREGILDFKSASTLGVGFPIGVYGDARLAINSKVKELVLKGLVGDGTVTNETASSVTPFFTGGTKDSPFAFAGKVDSGVRVQINSGVQYFTSPEWAEKMYSPIFGGTGRMGFYMFPGELVFRASAAAVDYVGEGGTWTSGTIWLNNGTYSAEIGGGPNGGLTMQGKLQLNAQKYNGGAYMMVVSFSGDHATPCVFDGDLTSGTDFKSVDAAAYLKKTGTGTWRFADTAGRNSRENRGTVAVEKGTLEYETIAERHSNCSLGTASCCHSEYYGARNDSKAVPYAYLLGDGSKANGAATATMKYVGTAAKTITNRLVAVKGEGRFAADAPLNWTGFTSVQAGDNTLILGGSAAGCVARGFTNGVGTLSVAKDGSGDWTVLGTNGVKSAFAKEGVLKVDCVAARGYSWYRLKMKELQGTATKRSSGTFTLYDLVLWNDQGKCSEGLAYNSTAKGDNWLLLQPGQVTVSRPANSQDYSVVSNWFDEEAKDASMLSLPSSPFVENESSWVVVTMRLPIGKENATRYDMSVFGTAVPDRNPKAWSLEASRDGVEWVELHRKTDLGQYPGVLRTWSSDQAKNGAWTSAKPAGFELVPASKTVCHPFAVGAAKGATLQCLGGVTANGLDFDAADEGGTVTGVSLADEGTITIRNLPARDDPRWVNGRIFLPHDFSGVDDLAKASTWPVVVDGVENTKYNVTITAEGLELTKKGLLILVK